MALSMKLSLKHSFYKQKSHQRYLYLFMMHALQKENLVWLLICKNVDKSSAQNIGGLQKYLWNNA